MDYNRFKIKVNKRELLQCASNVEKLKFSFNKEIKEFSDGIFGICHYYPCSSTSLLDEFEIYPDEKSIIGYSKIDYYNFLELLCKTLDIDISKININNQSENTIISLLKDKAIMLRSMNDFNKFKEMFPTLLKFYNISKNNFNKAYDYRDLGNEKKYSSIVKDEYNKGNKLKLFGISKNVKGNTLLKFVNGSSFCECQANVIKQIIRHKDELKEYFDNTLIERNFFADYKMDNDKFLVYLLFKYIEKAETLEEKDKYDLLKLVEERINQIKNKDTYVIIDNNKVTYNDLCNEYIRVLEGKNKPRTIFIDGDIVTAGNVINHQNNNQDRKTKVLTIDEKNQLIEYNEELFNFYEDSGYIGKLVVKNGIEGDIGFVYPNGEIIIDYISPDYLDSNLKKLKNRGIYHTDINNFNRLKGTSRMKLREKLKKIRPDSKVFTTHKGNYQERVLDMINEGLYDPFNEELTRVFLDDLEEDSVKKK